MTIQDTLKKSTALLQSHNLPSASLDAEVLLLEVLKRNHKNIEKGWLYAHNDYVLSKKEEKKFNESTKRRLKQEPVAYIVNRKEFYGYDFYVDKNVLIPRPETELIVEKVLEKISSAKKNGIKNFNLVDIGTGSGCIIISILNELKKHEVGKAIRVAIANDISKKALRVAEFNAKKYGLTNKIKFIAGDFEKALNSKYMPRDSICIITANLPYVSTKNFATLAPNVKKYEPKIAIIGGQNGLEIIKRFVLDISASISASEQNAGFAIFIEADPRQMKEIANIAKKEFSNANIEIIKDLRQKKRVIAINHR